MKTQLHHWPGRSVLSLCPPVLALTLLLAALPTRADTSFTTTNWVAGVPVPGILCTNASGQVYLKGNVHVHRVLSADARFAGRLTAWMDLAYQADGTALICGPAYVEPGTWDATGTNFTPSGGVWDTKYNGVVQADGSDQIHLVGYGIGSMIEGLRMECTATKGPGAPFDPAIPYFSSGTIKPAPLDRLVISDNFTNGFSWTRYGLGTGANIGTFAAWVTNQQLTLQATLNASSSKFNDMVAWANPDTPAWALQPGQTIEARVDLVSLGQAATVSGLCIYHTTGQAYVMVVATNWMAIGKQYVPGNAWFRMDKATIPTTNLVFVLALTPSGDNVIVSAKVLDKTSGVIVIHSSFVDTPSADPALTSAEVAQLTGCREWQDVRTDPAIAPWVNGTAPLLYVFQDAAGSMPPAQATFDNLAMRIYDVPRIGIQPVMRLTWLAPSGVNYAVEVAPTPQGPWQPLSLSVTDSGIPGMKQASVPANSTAQFFRLVQAP